MSEFIPAGTVTADQLKTRLNLKTDEEADRVLAVAVDTLTRATTSAWRAVPVTTWDDWLIRVAGAVAGARKRPSGEAGQLTTVDQGQVVVASRDYLAAVRAELVNYVELGIG